MTNQEIERLIERQRRGLRLASLGVPAVTGVLALVAFGLACLPALAELSLLFFAVALFCVVLSVGVVFDEARNRGGHGHKDALAIWNRLGDNHAFGFQLSDSTKRLGNDISRIYQTDAAGQLLPLRQAVRLLDTHNRQQQRLKLVENRLRELRQLQEALADKMAQLQQLGEDYPQGARNLEQIEADLAALGTVHGQIRGSCTRLEALVIGVQKVAQSRELRRELEGLSARVAPTSATVEPAFEAQSLEEIERQIGREIETYLQLERETEQHLQ